MTQSQELARWEIHAHTSPTSRCATLTARELARGLAEAGYYGVAITDHYDPERFFGATRGKDFRRQLHGLFDGYRAAQEAGERLGLRVLPSCELRIEAGNEDYLLYGANEEILAEAGYLGALPLARVREILSPMGVWIVQAHPFRPGQRPAAVGLLDGIEVYNANPYHDSRNALALALARERGLPMTRGSDVHGAGDIGGTCMMLPKIADEKELVAALRRYAKEENGLS